MDHSRVIVFGATGRTGDQIVRAATGRGVGITAFCRTTATLPDSWRAPEVSVCRGDVLSAADVRSAMTEASAIVIALGARPPYRDIFTARACETIIEAALKNGIQRLVCVTGAAVGRDLSHCSFAFRWLARVIERSNPELAEDRHRQDEVVAATTLNWTLVRPPRLTEGGATGKVRHGAALRIGLRSHISRADLADFVVTEVLDPRYGWSRVQVATGGA